jgi:hypothetical protein
MMDGWPGNLLIYCLDQPIIFFINLHFPLQIPPEQLHFIDVGLA